MLAILMASAKLTTLGIIQIKVFEAKAMTSQLLSMASPTKII